MRVTCITVTSLLVLGCPPEMLGHKIRWDTNTTTITDEAGSHMIHKRSVAHHPYMKNAAVRQKRDASNEKSNVVLTFINHCTEDLWMAAEGRSNVNISFTYGNISFFAPHNGGWHLPAGNTSQIEVPYDLSNSRFWARTGCTGIPMDDFSCETGDCGPYIECSYDGIPRGGNPPITLAEFTLNKNDKDYYDISLNVGFNVPIKIYVETYDESETEDHYWCTSPECLVNINEICPAELSVNGTNGVVACEGSSTSFKAHCHENTDNSNYKDMTSTFSCKNTNYGIKYCK